MSKRITFWGSILLVILMFCNGVSAQQCDIYVDNQQSEGNGVVTFCVLVNQAPNAIDAFGFDLTYESELLSFTGSWSEGDLTEGFDFFDVNVLSPGQIRVGGFTTQNMVGVGAAGTLVCLEFTVGDCFETALRIENPVNDIAEWARCDGNLSCLPEELTHIRLLSPAHQSILSGPPVFSWTPNGGVDNRFSVDMAIPPRTAVYSTWENLHLVIRDVNWVLPPAVWEQIPSGKQVFWRVRGVDLNHTPLTIVPSDETWSFFKD